MNAKELQALRKFLMLDVREAAEIIGGVSKRSWQYWEAGRSPVPQDVADKMEGLLTVRQTVLERLEAEALDYSDNPQDEHGERLRVPFYPTLAEFAAAHPEDGRLLTWRCHQSAAAELYASNLIRLE
ncbi:DUF1870 family protein [Halomonas daqingensis]|uniref:DUF1870 family protein n=1 Tax=Billgrantia desiderata TaxID=52021 RepID=A0ABS9B568_9GAMM|nr:DUF1870 family protein [Halomonas desiderata]MCE8042473.1 DUF1870 family protein [Halomonas desiderata]MCE8047048.1 DUF1870 family protein [Halomonas desiderata]